MDLRDDVRRCICPSAELSECGLGVRFQLRIGGETIPAFVVRYNRCARAYINRCAHLSLELDLMPGRLFNRERRYLICATHGALYDPDSGACVDGPCRGNGLIPVEVEETDGMVLLTDAQFEEVIK
ncbi:MAG: Rieske 2Fe-2S domain-containing protein [Gammaproteobacteria bacterium]|nr:Rieske 2Fe-2S domain-containing protein [Gammaproteobacteria bacterium]